MDMMRFDEESSIQMIRPNVSFIDPNDKSQEDFSKDLIEIENDRQFLNIEGNGISNKQASNHFRKESFSLDRSPFKY